eukprot:4685789-Amphidinium_carterae.1
MWRSCGFLRLQLEAASAELKCDFGIVLAAVSENGCALQYAGEALRGNFEMSKCSGLTPFA